MPNKTNQQSLEEMQLRLMRRNRDIHYLNYLVDELCCRVRYLEKPEANLTVKD